MLNIHSAGLSRWRGITAEQRTLSIAGEWLDEHRGKHVLLSMETVRRIVFRLADAGVEPTVQSVRTVNGGHGSTRAIRAGIRNFFERMDCLKPSRQPTVPSDSTACGRRSYVEVLRRARQLERIDGATRVGRGRTTGYTVEDFL